MPFLIVVGIVLFWALATADLGLAVITIACVILVMGVGMFIDWLVNR